MKRPLIVAALAALCATAVPGLASTPEKGTVGPGFIATSNVTHVRTVPVDTDIAGGRMVGKDFFVRTAKGITIYDTTNPELPTPKGFVAVPATPNQEREDIDTNGKILVTGQSYDGTLYVVDVKNRTTPTILSVLRGAAQHTNTCVLDCTFVYGSSGNIVDLRNPAAPVLLPTKWTTATGSGAGHDLTEVQPGLLLTATNPVTYIDAATDPTKPRRLTTGKLAAGDTRYMHGVDWPRKGADRFVLGGSETATGCQGELGSFVVWDTTAYTEGQAATPKVKREFERKGQYQLARGLQTDMEGKAPAAQHCGHWFDVHRTFEDGGLVAMAWYTFGVRFLDVTPEGEVVEKGFWQSLPGQSSAAYWASDDVLYVTDYTARGFDVLKYDRNKKLAKGEVEQGTFVKAGSAREKDAVAKEAADVKARGLATKHHGSLGALAQKWVCRPDGTMPLAG